jgi:hypothetical protein
MEKTLLEPAIGTEELELQYTYWQDGKFFVGFLNDYPKSPTQGFSLAELEEALAEVYEIKQEEKIHLAMMPKEKKRREPIRKTGSIKVLV